MPVFCVLRTGVERGGGGGSEGRRLVFGAESDMVSEGQMGGASVAGWWCCRPYRGGGLL